MNTPKDIFYQDARSVIARFLQRLTLIAFTAHAVLGCCWHHSHPLGEESCQLHVHHDGPSTGVDCCAHPTDPPRGPVTLGSGQPSGSFTIHECHHHDGHSDGPLATAERTSATLVSMGACPCNHTHECDEARCSYVPRQANPSDGYLSIPVGDLIPLSTELFAWSRLDLRRFDTDRSGGRPVESSQQRCANLQSWQI